MTFDDMFEIIRTLGKNKASEEIKRRLMLIPSHQRMALVREVGTRQHQFVAMGCVAETDHAVEQGLPSAEPARLMTKALLQRVNKPK